MNVFISSVIAGLEPYRDAAALAIAALGYTAKRSEDYGASPASPQSVCLQGVRDADCLVLLLGERYGFVQPSGLSATHEEYREARERIDVLAFTQRGITPEPAQEVFIKEVRDWATGHFTDEFSSESELRQLVTQRLFDLQVAKASGRVEPEELLRRAYDLANRVDHGQEPVVSVIFVPGPKQVIVPPSQLDDPAFRALVQRQAQFAELPIFDRLEATKETIQGDALVMQQGTRRIIVEETGAIRIDQAAAKHDRLSMPVLIEEHVTNAVQSAVRFAGWLLDEVDPRRRLSDVALLGALIDCRYYAWRTMAEHRDNPNSVTMSSLGDRIIVEPSRPLVQRAGLLHDTSSLVEDIVARLRRAAKS